MSKPYILQTWVFYPVDYLYRAHLHKNFQLPRTLGNICRRGSKFPLKRCKSRGERVKTVIALHTDEPAQNGIISQEEHSQREKILWFLFISHTSICQYFGTKDLHRDTENCKKSEIVFQIMRIYHKCLPRCC